MNLLVLRIAQWVAIPRSASGCRELPGAAMVRYVSPAGSAVLVLLERMLKMLLLRRLGMVLDEGVEEVCWWLVVLLLEAECLLVLLQVGGGAMLLVAVLLLGALVALVMMSLTVEKVVWTL